MTTADAQVARLLQLGADAQHDAEPRILVVDDDPTSLHLIAEILDGKGFSVTYATNGADALELVEEQPELMLLDLHLPDMDGFEVCRRLKAQPQFAAIPVMFLTANQDPVLEAQGLEVGAVDFVTKPYSAAVLRARTNTHVALARKTQLLERMAFTDGLTGAANRRYFNAQLAAEWARALRNRADLAVVLLDIDHFKSINDTYGHDEGDRCLRELVRLVTPFLRRPADVLARFGGEEFVALLPETSLEGAIHLAEQMRAAVQHGFDGLAAAGAGPRVTASFGCAACCPTHLDSADELIRHADQHLYAAKAGGRNRVEPVVS